MFSFQYTKQFNMMKNFYLSAAFLLVFALGAKAQTSQTGTTNVHVQMNDVMSITVNHADVYLRFLQAADYVDGVTSPQSAHLTVTSNKAYNLNVSAAGNLAGGVVGNTDFLSPGVIAVSLPLDGNNTSLGGTRTAVAELATTNGALISAATAAAGKSIDVLYAVPSTVSRTNKILGKVADTYTTVVTYTLTQ
jgi:hypothetical protein